MNMILDNTYLTLGIVLGALFIATWIMSVGAIIQRNHVTMGLVFLNWSLIIDMAYLLALGTIIWVFTLHELVNFHKAYSEQTPAARIAIQDMFHCCGYFNNTDLVEVGGTFCANSTFVSQSNSLCWSPITSKADSTLDPIFTTIYGFMAIIGSLFLITLCVISERKTEERFKKIDAKRGGQGFV